MNSTDLPAAGAGEGAACRMSEGPGEGGDGSGRGGQRGGVPGGRGSGGGHLQEVTDGVARLSGFPAGHGCLGEKTNS